MFLQRLISTLILIPLVLFAIYFSNYWFFASTIFLLMLICGYEWAHLVPINCSTQKLLFLLVLSFLFFASYFLYAYWLFLGLFLWAFIAYAEIKFPERQSLWAYPIFVVVMAAILLPLFAHSLILIFLAPQGRASLVYLLFLVWAADIGAYLVGKRWGQHKLIPAVSPGKTFEGLAGGSALGILVALGAFHFFDVNPVCWFAAAFTIIVISLIGDLAISMLKRRIDVKDTGHLIPGHGGILDRLDSLIAAAPLFYCWLLIFGQ